MTRSQPTLRLTALACLGTLLGGAALAEGLDDSDHYAYGGLSYGRNHFKLNENNITNVIAGPGLATTGISSDDRHASYKVFGGYQFNRALALEGGYFYLGRDRFVATTTPAGTLTGDIKIHGINMDVVGTLPITQRFAALGRVGLQYARTSDSFAGSGAVAVANPNPTKGKASYKAGLGLQYALTPMLFVRGEAERYRVADAMGNTGAVNVFSLGLIIPFGRASSPRVAMAPAYVAPASVEPARVMEQAPPAAGPVAQATVVAPPPERRRVTFEAEQMFSFDTSNVRPEGKAGLDTFAKQLDGTRFDAITVEGHTDRLGTEAYNQTLSEQRAEAVKSYLVSEGKVDASKIKAVGKSGSDPVTKPGDCKGTARTAKLIACLQPDRRVEVEVIGTR